MNSYIYNSDIGTFEIKQLEHKRYELWLKEELLGSYASAEFAAQDVADFNTDDPKWDKFENRLHNFPTDLSQWSQIKEELPE